jgi:hypothetical protein
VHRVLRYGDGDRNGHDLELLPGWDAQACGTVLKVFVMLPEVHHGLVVDQATVCWSRGHEVGLTIRDINEQEVLRLQNFITACM